MWLSTKVRAPAAAAGPAPAAARPGRRRSARRRPRAAGCRGRRGRRSQPPPPPRPGTRSGPSPAAAAAAARHFPRPAPECCRPARAPVSGFPTRASALQPCCACGAPPFARRPSTRQPHPAPERAAGAQSCAAQCALEAPAPACRSTRASRGAGRLCAARRRASAPAASALPSGRQQSAVSGRSGVTAHRRCQLRRCRQSWPSPNTSTSRSIVGDHAARATSAVRPWSSRRVNAAASPSMAPRLEARCCQRGPVCTRLCLLLRRCWRPGQYRPVQHHGLRTSCNHGSHDSDSLQY